MTRRTLLFAGAARAAALLPRFRFALCNDPFAGWPFPKMCEAVKRAGFAGVELAPGTLAEDATRLTSLQVREIRNAIVDSGLQYAGMHNLLVSPKGLHATTADATLRRRTWDYLRRLVDLGAELGELSVLVFGSGKQRGAPDAAGVADAAARLREGLAELAPAAQVRSVTVLIEPLSRQFTNVVNTVAEAAQMVRRINSPAVRTMLDTHNTTDETLPAGNLIRAYAPLIRHIHVNEMDGRHPGAGDYDFHPVLQALHDTGYNGWVSAEVFDFSPGPERIAAETGAFLRKLEAGVR